MSDWQKTATQARSRDTERALARAARDLLSREPFPDITVAQVARRAGVSVGGFYARFRGKSALLHLADIDFLEDARRAFDEAVPEDFAGSLDETLQAFVEVMVRQFDEHRDSIVQGMRFAGEDDTSAFRLRATQFNEHVHGRMRRLLIRHRDRIVHADPERAVNMVLFMASASAREAVLRGALSVYPVDPDLDQLIDDLVLAATRYLGGGAA